ncbi:hypothetical protein [Caudoviricetes sp.]|nr:hypothetical protein [Caudoviricetes sp.]
MSTFKTVQLRLDKDSVHDLTEYLETFFGHVGITNVRCSTDTIELVGHTIEPLAAAERLGAHVDIQA